MGLMKDYIISMAKVSLTGTGEDLYTAVTGAIGEIDNELIAPGDCVLLKPNLVEPAAPDSGQITSPDVIEAVARYCIERGAGRVIIGEGPSYYQPKSYLRECFTGTGVSMVAERLGIEWVLFDEYGYRTFRGVSDYTPSEFRVTEFAFNCDKFINLPVLKTHYLTEVTLSMKNLKGCLKREDKPSFHYPDLSRAVVELCRIVKPTINIIDCTAKTVARQLGMGYMPESGRSGGGMLIASRDIVAADAVGCALMGLDPAGVRMVSLGAAVGLGECDLARMEIVGEDIKRLKFRVKLPREQLREDFPLLEVTGAERACSGCIIPLFSALSVIKEWGIKLNKPLAVILGKGTRVPADGDWLMMGDCTKERSGEAGNRVDGCPVTREDVLNGLIRTING